MRKMRRILLVLIACGLIVSLTMIIPAGAATSSSDTKALNAELVAAETNSIGDVTGIQVVDMVSLHGSGTVNVREDKNFAGNLKYQGIHGFDTPKVEGDQIVWGDLSGDNTSVSASTYFSKDQVNQAQSKIPFKTHYTYTLDGKKVQPEDITGKSGHFRMELTMTNDSKEMTTVDVKDPATGEMKPTQVETYLPMVIVPYNWNFDTKVFHNMTCDETGIIFYFPEFSQVGWSIPLFPPATEASDTIWIEADVTDFSIPTLTLPVAFLFPKSNQTDPIPVFKSGLEQLYGGVKQMDQGLGDAATTNTLINGISQVDTGLQQMAGSNGLPAAKTGLDTLLIPGVDQAVAGIGSTSTANSLLYAMGQMKGGLAAMQAAMNQMLAGIGNASSPATTILGALTAINSLLQLWDGQLGTVIADLSAVSTDLKPGGTAYNYVNTLINTDPSWPTQKSTILGYFGTDAASLTTTITTLTAMKGLMEYVISQGPALTDGVNQIKAGLQGMAAGIGSASTANTLLWAVDQTTQGLQQIKGGLSSGSASSPGLKEGLQQVSSGLSTAIAGLGSASTANSLLYGTGQISSALTQMKSGTSQMSQGLTDNLLTLNATEPQLAAIEQRGKDFDSFLGKPQGTNVDGQVRFLFQTKPTYDYKTSGSVLTAIILSVILLLLLVGGSILLMRRRMT